MEQHLPKRQCEARQQEVPREGEYMSGRLPRKLERDKRIELSPPPWQGGVLPLYESRRTKDLHRREFIAWQPQADKSLQQKTRAGTHRRSAPKWILRL
jgi:hypothetical protein